MVNLCKGTHRFLNRDPAGYNGGLDLYQYAFNNPVMMADPSGLNPCDNGGPGDDNGPGCDGQYTSQFGILPHPGPKTNEYKLPNW